MRRIVIVLLSLFITSLITPSSNADEYLDKRWAKTGCKPLNKETKNALIPTDWDTINQYYNPEDGSYTEKIENNQSLVFYNPNFGQYKYLRTSNSGKNGKGEKLSNIIIPLFQVLDSSDQISAPVDKSIVMPIDRRPYYRYSLSHGSYKGACSEKNFKGMIFTVYLLKDKKDKKPYKWLQFQSTGKGTK